MATTNVPIEIVLQDPDNPIVPTPDPANPGESGENTNIAVPNTALGEGYTTKDGGSSDAGSFFSSSAGATIIPAVVLTLAIATIVALLIHKYRKNKKTGETKATRQEKLATVATSTVAVLAAVVLVSQLGMTATNAATGSEGTTLSTPDKIQIIANRYSDVTIVASAEAVSYATTDTTFGYKLFMSMAGDTGNLYLDGNTDSEYYFAPTTRTGLDPNSWGYNYDGEADYYAMPLAADPLMAQQNINAVEDEEFTVYYIMKADKDMPFGVYSGEIAYDIEGYNGFPSTLTTMQGMTSAICDAAYTPSGTETVVPTATLEDTRDHNTYEVAKLADGNCWMIQNLDLDLDSQTALTPENTHISSSWTPTNSTIAFTGTSVSGWQNNNNVPYSADPGPLYIYSSGNTNQDDQYTSLADCQAAHPDCSAKNHVGNYYNWSAAVAMNDTSEYGNDDQYTNVDTDICPKGWKLPKGPQSSDQFTNNEFNTLLSGYDGTIVGERPNSCGGLCPYYKYASGGFNTIRTAPLWLAWSGNVVSGSLNSTASYGYYWSSTVVGSGNAYCLDFNSSYVSPASSIGRDSGYSVRCVAK